MSYSAPSHHVHIPVMGTGFTIDTPIKLARYGIDSVISLVDDNLIEQMREYYSRQEGLEYQRIKKTSANARSRRISSYLDLVNQIVNRDFVQLKESELKEGTELYRYCELMPENELKFLFRKCLDTTDVDTRNVLEQELRSSLKLGSIDVNIMTKLDREQSEGELSDALAALDGFANSDLSDSSVIFSAGLNPRLYTYLQQFDDFRPLASGEFRKKIAIKVSDFRSAAIQGKFLAKRGLWISEFRIESGINCGGHAFASGGKLMGTVLEEFKHKRAALFDELKQIYLKALGDISVDLNLKQKISAQGGLGTAKENQLILDYFEADSVGWGSPFLLVPEVTNVDDQTLEQLIAATEDDIYLSDNSPLGVPIWNLRNSESEIQKAQKIEDRQPGSPCPKGYLALDKEFSEHGLCKASALYQSKKLQQLEDRKQRGDLDEAAYKHHKDLVLEKACICHELAGGALIVNQISNKVKSAVCCGPGILAFKHLMSLEEIFDHIYGRKSVFENKDARPHALLKEIYLYIDHLEKQMREFSQGLIDLTEKEIKDFVTNIQEGLDLYTKILIIKPEEGSMLENILEDLQDRFQALTSSC